MRKPQYFLYLVIPALLLTAGCGQELTGRIRVPEGQSLLLRDTSGNVVSLSSGSAKIKLEEQGVFLSSKMSLSTAQGNWEFEIPKDAYVSPTDFQLPEAESGQPATVRGKYSSKLVSENQKEETIDCQHAGYCTTCSPGLDMKMSCGFKYSLSCSGEQKARVDHKHYSDFYQVTFSNNGTPIGEFDSNPTPRDESSVIQTLSSCE